MQEKIFCVGTDARSEYIRKLIKKATSYEKADIIILPYPVKYDRKIREILLSLSDQQKLFFGGKLPRKYMSKPNVISYSKAEDFLQKNARLTAEGLLSIVIRELPLSLGDSCVAITGFGRIGKETKYLLDAVGSSVTVFSRQGYKKYSEFERLAEHFDCVINTSPVLVLDEKKLQALRPDCLLIESASAPYGIDFEAAKKLDLKTILASGLPGKTSPESAARLILEEIEKLYSEGG